MDETQPPSGQPAKPDATPAIPPSPSMRMASLPQTGPPPAASAPAAPVDPPGVIITEETEESRAAEAALEKQNFFQRLFNRKK